MRRLTLIALTCFAVAATASAQTMRDYTVSWPAASEADMLAAYAAAYPQTWATTLADASTAPLVYGLTVCVPASAADVEAMTCVERETTLQERRIILRRALRQFMRDHYLAKVGGDAATSARAAALAKGSLNVPAEP